MPTPLSTIKLSQPELAEAKLTPVRKSSEVRLSSRYVGTASLMPSADVVEKTPHDQYYKGNKYIISSRNTNLFDDMKKENISATTASF